ncbi:MAG: C-terminal binding protein [Planctomycetota bacterium]|nr:C-terminal binding protein [Planctomycetota bacterium]
MSKKFKVVVTDHVFDSFDIEHEALAGADAELAVCQCKTQDEMREAVKDADAVLNTYLGGLDKSVFASAPKLRVVVRYGIGLDTINVPDATACGIMVANVPDYCIEEVADHATALFLTLARKTALSDAQVKGGQWSLSYLKPLAGITDMTAGVIGFGRIGKAIAARLKPFGLRVTFYDPAIDRDTDGAECVDFRRLLENSDVIFVQCPSTEATRHLLNKDAFAAMKKKPLVINAARGAIVDTDAMAWALEKNLVSGAGLDVLEDIEAVVEKDHPFKSLPNVVLTPHSAWYSESAIQKLHSKAVGQVVQVLNGEQPTYLVNPEALEKK